MCSIYRPFWLDHTRRDAEKNGFASPVSAGLRLRPLKDALVQLSDFNMQLHGQVIPHTSQAPRRNRDEPRVSAGAVEEMGCSQVRNRSTVHNCSTSRAGMGGVFVNS